MTRIDKIENKILDYQNEIISLTKIEEELWDYHPDNPDKIDVKDSYQKIKDKIYDLELKIEEEEERLDYIKKEFDAQLEKMQYQDKHKYKEVRDRWQYAHDKVTRLHANKAKK